MVLNISITRFMFYFHLKDNRVGLVSVRQKFKEFLPILGLSGQPVVTPCIFPGVCFYPLEKEILSDYS